jgi:hypothetical protein
VTIQGATVVYPAGVTSMAVRDSSLGGGTSIA